MDDSRPHSAIRSRMRAAILTAPRTVAITEAVRPEPRSDELCVELEGCGLCASNLPVWEGKPWFTYPLEPGAPGHEGWGKICSIGAGVIGFRPGERGGLLSYHGCAEFEGANQNAVGNLPSTTHNYALPRMPLV